MPTQLPAAFASIAGYLGDANAASTHVALVHRTPLEHFQSNRTREHPAKLSRLGRISRGVGSLAHTRYPRRVLLSGKTGGVHRTLPYRSIHKKAALLAVTVTRPSSRHSPRRGCRSVGPSAHRSPSTRLVRDCQTGLCQNPQARPLDRLNAVLRECAVSVTSNPGPDLRSGSGFCTVSGRRLAGRTSCSCSAHDVLAAPRKRLTTLRSAGQCCSRSAQVSGTCPTLSANFCQRSLAGMVACGAPVG